jgi:hypothetical protein
MAIVTDSHGREVHIRCHDLVQFAAELVRRSRIAQLEQMEPEQVLGLPRRRR